MEKNIENYLHIASRLFSIAHEDDIFKKNDTYIFTINKNNFIRLWNLEINFIQDVEIIHYGYFNIVYSPTDKIPQDLYDAWNKGQINLKHVSKSFHTRELNVRIIEKKQYIDCKLKKYDDNIAFCYNLGSV